MRRSGSIIVVHQVPAGTKRGGHAPFMRDGSIPSPCNCKAPCCYGRGRNFCWPCMKNIIAEHNANRKG